MSKSMTSGWTYKKLNKLGSVGRGKSKHRPRNDPSLYGGPYPFIQTGEIKAADLYISDYSQTYNEKGLAQSKLWDPGTLCITIAANIAETAILKIRACFPDSIVGFVADPQESDVRFVKYYIDLIKLQMQNISRGTTQDNLSLDKLLSFDLLVPSVDEQREISGILSSYDDLIANNTRRIKILEEMAQMVYREWFVHFRFPGHEHVRIVDSAIGKVPEGWEVGPFTDYVNVLSGGTPKTSNPDYWNGDIPWFTPADLSGRFFVVDTERKITHLGLLKCNSKLYPIDTVFITARGTVGNCVMNSVPMAMSQTNYALRAKDVPQRIVYLMTLNLVNALKQSATGAVFDTIVVDTFRKQIIVRPPDDLLARIDGIIKPVFGLLLKLQLKNTNLRNTRDLLLPRLMSGQVRFE